MSSEQLLPLLSLLAAVVIVGGHILAVVGRDLRRWAPPAEVVKYLLLPVVLALLVAAGVLLVVNPF